MNEVNLARQDRFSDARAYARSTEFRATMLDAQRTLFKPRIISTQAELTKLTETATEGDQVLCRNGQGGLWRFVYDPNNPEVTDAYKWVFMGGAGLSDTELTDQSTASLYPTFVDLAGVANPAVTAPYSGIYRLEAKVECYINLTTNVALANFFVNGAAVSGVGAAHIEVDHSVATRGLTGSAFHPGATVLAGQEVKMMYCHASAAGTANFRDRFLSITPVRIGP